jgi:MtN3 and saliva related transmembrane protein
MTLTSVLGFLAGCITVIGFMPQALRVWRTRQTRDLSLGTFALLASGAALWLTYGILLRNGPIIFTNAAVGFLVCTIIIAKLRYDRVTPLRQNSPAPEEDGGQ